MYSPRVYLKLKAYFNQFFFQINVELTMCGKKIMIILKKLLSKYSTNEFILIFHDNYYIYRCIQSRFQQRKFHWNPSTQVTTMSNWCSSLRQQIFYRHKNFYLLLNYLKYLFIFRVWGIDLQPQKFNTTVCPDANGCQMNCQSIVKYWTILT